MSVDVRLCMWCRSRVSESKSIEDQVVEMVR
jgi:hypothetical protein